MTTIAVDAMGGDNAPLEIVKGVAEAVKEYKTSFILVGDGEQIEPLAREFQMPEDSYEILHTDEAISMDESPRDALEEKPKSSIALSAKLLADKKAEALVSAGSTGAVVLAAKKYVPLIEGVERSALATIYPTANFSNSKFGYSFLLDAGATLHCTARHLVHFALMGHNYSLNILGVESPRIGLLNVGTEPVKGGQVLSRVYHLLSEIPSLNFIGNIEGKDIPPGEADVVVCEGMTGNIVLKMMEGVGEALMSLGQFTYKQKLSYRFGLALLSSGIKKMKKRIDYSEYGGAPILGFRHLCVKAHGRSNAKAISKAVGVAVTSVKNDLCEKIKDSVKEFNQHIPFDDE